jgi:histone deacetylase complex regulatory component SIN3
MNRSDEEALLYMEQVKIEFGDRPHIYIELFDILNTFKS